MSLGLKLQNLLTVLSEDLLYLFYESWGKFNEIVPGM